MAIGAIFVTATITTMSKNNTIRKSDKKYIRTQKALIRRQFLDVKKQQEMIDALYAKFIKKEGVTVEKAPAPKKASVKKVEPKKAKAKK